MASTQLIHQKHTQLLGDLSSFYAEETLGSLQENFHLSTWKKRLAGARSFIIIYT
jgi:hypothetical protein